MASKRLVWLAVGLAVWTSKGQGTNVDKAWQGQRQAGKYKAKLGLAAGARLRTASATSARLRSAAGTASRARQSTAHGQELDKVKDKDDRDKQGWLVGKARQMSGKDSKVVWSSQKKSTMV